MANFKSGGTNVGCVLVAVIGGKLDQGDEALKMCSKHPNPIHVLLWKWRDTGAWGA